MPANTKPVMPIEPGAYTEEYYRSAVEGHQQFAESGGRAVSARMVRALELADVRSGQCVLDIACGRGEVVLQSALRGARAVGIDYAQASMSIAKETLSGAPDAQADVARMDATRLAFAPDSFDVALMLDFVEHVYQPDLDAAFAEIARALKPGGRLVIHTSPNRLFEDVVYRHYVRNVHRLLLTVAGLFRIKNRLINELVLPPGPVPPHNEYERELHVNAQTGRSLRQALQAAGLRVRRVDVWEPPQDPFFPKEERALNFWLGVLDVVRFIRPFSKMPPVNRLFSNHIWVVAEAR
ncbi:MAG: class I SAM-dependent methyltransferase [Chloroflexi bacterium]|nr:class I SAM-dependent methyltransferase [Chloroflexota bacterium]MCI0856533.1 class I SAM-dependent methyltransferase [Chloroflexota bacterium]MCI0889552.1 class I SAM-dependent methyltransferase [Chloroflexota bacterium]